jgi:hypothetical protein
MTDLLDPADVRAFRGAPREPSGAGAARPLAMTAAVGGVASAVAALLGCMLVALVGWFASDAGAHGTTRDALRVGADGWLLAQGGHLHLPGASATITAVPLGLTLLCLYLAHRAGRWAASRSAVDDLRTLLLGLVVLAGCYGLLALVTALLASTPSAEPSLLGSLAGGLVVAVVGGGSGLLRGSRDTLGWAERVPEPVRAITLGAVAATLLVVVASSVLLAVALLMDLGSAANVLSRLHAGVSGGLLSTVLVAAVAPNAVLLTGSYLLGPGFALGAGTLVSPGAVTLAPVPAFPLLAALPPDGTPPPWLSALVVAPVAAAVVGVVLMVRRHPALTYDGGILRGLGAGVAAGLLVALLVVASGGAVGPGRMADVGAGALDTLVSAVVAMGLGGLFAGVATTWWARRH